MRLIEKQNYFGPYWVLEGIKQTDIRFANLAGRYTGGTYEDPNKPKHEYLVWIDDPDILAWFQSQPIVVRTNSEESIAKTGETRYSVTFKAYPKMKLNRRTMQEEQVPFVLMRTGDGDQRLKASAFGLVDSAHVDTVDISFHLWQYDEKKPNCVLSIDELICNVDETAGEVDSSYLRDKYKYVEEVEADMAADETDSEEEVPFE